MNPNHDAQGRFSEGGGGVGPVAMTPAKLATLSIDNMDTNKLRDHVATMTAAGHGIGIVGKSKLNRAMRKLADKLGHGSDALVRAQAHLDARVIRDGAAQ